MRKRGVDLEEFEASEAFLRCEPVSHETSMEAKLTKAVKPDFKEQRSRGGTSPSRRGRGSQPGHTRVAFLCRVFVCAENAAGGGLDRP